MARPRFYVATPLGLGEHVLPEQTAHYVTRVLRMDAGAELQLFDGSGQEFAATLVQSSKKSATVQVTEQLEGLAESPLRIHLGQAVSKGDRMDWAIQKATELGVTEITPLLTEHGEVRLNEERAQKRQEHWQQVAISACEQSGRSHVPVIHPIQKLNTWMTQPHEGLKLVLHPYAKALSEYAPTQQLTVLIGPEGGLSENEVEAALTQGFNAVSLGPRILRTETAPVAVLAIAQHLWGDF